MRKQNWNSFLSVDSNKMELYKFNPLLSSLNQQRQKDAGQNETLDVSVQAISRCDMVSLLSSVRKKTIWEVQKSLPEISEVFQQLSAIPDEVTKADQKEIEIYAILIAFQQVTFH